MRPRGHGPKRRFDRQRMCDLYASGLTIREVAKAVGCTYGFVWKVVSGWIDSPTDYRAARRAEARESFDDATEGSNHDRATVS